MNIVVKENMVNHMLLVDCLLLFFDYTKLITPLTTALYPTCRSSRR
jgi:hypothetical protein